MNGPSAWWAEPSRPKREPSLFPGRMIETQLTIEILTDRLADESRSGPGERIDHGYYDALDDLRELVNLPPTDRSRRDDVV